MEAFSLPSFSPPPFLESSGGETDRLCGERRRALLGVRELRPGPKVVPMLKEGLSDDSEPFASSFCFSSSFGFSLSFTLSSSSFFPEVNLNRPWGGSAPNCNLNGLAPPPKWNGGGGGITVVPNTDFCEVPNTWAAVGKIFFGASGGCWVSMICDR